MSFQPSPLERKIRVLALTDSPTCRSGFGRVAKDIFKLLPREKYEFDFVGVNYHASPLDVLQDWPDRIIAANPTGRKRDYFGRQLTADLVASMARGNKPYDILWVQGDLDMVSPIAAVADDLRREGRLAGICFYCPLDADPEHKASYFNSITEPDVFATYSHNAAQMIGMHIDTYVKVVHPGVDTSVFYPIEDIDKVQEFRRRYLRLNDPDTFVVASVNRNQHRKDLPRLLMAFKDFVAEKPNSVLYMHCDPVDKFCDLKMVAFKLGLEGRVLFAPQEMRFAAPDFVMNMVYNSAHVVATMSRGEGWGLSVPEAMAAGTPVIAAYNTAHIDQLGEEAPYQPPIDEVFDQDPIEFMLCERGIAVYAGMSSEMWNYGHDGMRRPVASIMGMRQALNYVHSKYLSIRSYLTEQPLALMVGTAKRFAAERWRVDTGAERWDKIFTDLVGYAQRGEQPPRLR